MTGHTGGHETSDDFKTIARYANFAYLLLGLEIHDDKSGEDHKDLPVLDMLHSANSILDYFWVHFCGKDEQPIGEQLEEQIVEQLSNQSYI